MTPAPGPDSCYNLAARRNARSLTRLYDRHLAPARLSVSQFSILAIVARREGIGIAALAEVMVMERTTLMRAMKRLEEDGLIERRAGGGRKAIALFLTDAGRARAREAAPLWQAAQAAYERRVGAGRAARLRDAILEIGFET